MATEAKIREAVAQIVKNLKEMGYDPYVDVTSERLGIIIPVEQVIQQIMKHVNKKQLNAAGIDVEVKEATVGAKSFIVIKVFKLWKSS